jgi:hypothetical protein
MNSSLRWCFSSTFVVRVFPVRCIDNNKDIDSNRDIDNNKDVKWNNMCGFKRPKIYLL